MDLIGKTLGKHLILEEIGRGGMGAVFKARHTILGSLAAVKVLAPHMAWDPDVQVRFLREARTVACLSHPSIVTVYDAGEQDGTYYLVMSLVEGESLSQVLAREGPLPPERAAHLLAQLAAVLDYAHGVGIIHGDVKPGNILVTAADQAVLTDFGIAHVMEATHLTATGKSLGTPAFMSPEQVRGEPAGVPSDVYSLGVVL